MEKYTLENGINIKVKYNNSTPRTAVVLYARINDNEKVTGLFYLMTELLYQGTKNRTAEELAIEMDENAIDISVEKKSDFIRFKLYCLNEDIEKGLELLQDIVENSTFDNYEKEIIKIKGEFEADLDSAKIQAQDEYYRTIFKNHPYGTGRKEIMEAVSTVKKQDLIEAYNEIKYKAQKNISIAGNTDIKELKELIKKHFSNLKTEDIKDTRKKAGELEENRISVIEKEDANQAQIFKGWVLPSIYDKNYPVFILLNTILGASGLSSRLFLELREKQGLAYTVRSVYEPYVLGGNFFVYIATEPKNIAISLKGFEKEINKIIEEEIGEEELENAKNNAIGKRQFYRETNLMDASLNGYYDFMELEDNFEEKLIENIKSITSKQLKETAKKYFSKNNALTVLAPKEYLREAKLK